MYTIQGTYIQRSYIQDTYINKVKNNELFKNKIIEHFANMNDFNKRYADRKDTVKSLTFNDASNNIRTYLNNIDIWTDCNCCLNSDPKHGWCKSSFDPDFQEKPNTRQFQDNCKGAEQKAHCSLDSSGINKFYKQ